MFNHIMIGTNDIEKSKAFYEKVLKVIGVQGAVDNTLDSGIKRAFFIHDGNVLALSQPIDDDRLQVRFARTGQGIARRRDRGGWDQHRRPAGLARKRDGVDAPVLFSRS